MAGPAWGAQVDLATPLKSSWAEARRWQRQVDRQRRATNPGNYLPDGRVRPGPKRWQVSHKQRQSERKLAEAQRRASAHRRSLHGQLANDLLRLGDDIRIERNSARSSATLAVRWDWLGRPGL